MEMTVELKKEIPITQAKEGESLHINTLGSYRSFKDELGINGVEDIFNQSKVQIKQDNLKYIFVINNEPKFLVDKIRMQDWITQFYMEQTNDELAIRLLDTQLQYIKGGYKGELDNLRGDIAMEWSVENAKFKVDRYIEFFKQEKGLAKENTAWFRGQKYDRKDTGLRDIQKVEINRRIEQLEKIKKQIERLENNQGKKYTINKKDEVREVKMDDINAEDMEITILQLNQRIEEIGKEAPEFIKTRNEIVMENGDTTPYYEIIMNNVKDNASLKLAFQKINNDLALTDKMALSADKRRALERDLENLQEYLEKYMNNPETFDPAKEPFVAKSGAIFEEFYKQNPVLKNLIKLNARAGKKSWEKPNPDYPGTEAYANGAEGRNVNGQEEDNTWWNNGKEWKNSEKKGEKTYVPSEYDNAKEAFAKWGINGEVKYRIDQTNMKPEQKQFRSGVGNLAVTGGMIFIGVKMLKSAWNLIMGKHKGSPEEKRKDRARLIAPTALIFGSQARTGEGPMGLFTWWVASEKVAGLFGRDGETTEGSEQDKETKIKYTSFPGATALFNGLSYGEMSQFLIQDGDEIKIDPDRYDALLDMFENSDKKNPAAAEFLKSIGKDDSRHVIDLALTGMGITSLQQLENTPDAEFNKTSTEAIIRLREIVGHMDDNMYNKINSETQYLVDDYISGKGEYSLDELDARGDVFYEEIEVVDKTGLQDRVKELAEGDPKKEEELLLAINTFWEKMPNGERNIELRGTRSTIEFVTYEQSSAINLEKKTLTGFTPDRFDSYAELFKVANLTNRIQAICKDKVSQKPEPFYVDTVTGDITFDNAKFWSTDFDTRIMSGGRGGELANTSPILETYKKEYATYLNGLRDWKVVAPEVAPREPEVARYTGLDTQINAITTDPAIRAELSTGISLFYNYMPSGEKKIEISGTRPTIEFKTYWKTTKINLSTKTIEGFSANKAFPTYFELFKAANLTNRIKYICKTKEPVDSIKPFDISTLGNIVFDDANVLSKEFDTTIMTGGRFGWLKDVSPVLEENKQAYVDYLNYLAPWKELDPMTFDPATKTLKISNGEFKITVKEFINGVWTEVDADITQNIDTNLRLIIQRWTTVSLNTEATFDDYEHGHMRKITVRRTK